ncbi:MAG: hypothetical protein GYB68_11335 [Chloroflexi bacterium]|nr:hypothetical protein [Chloroflexota bacterium]
MRKTFLVVGSALLLGAMACAASGGGNASDICTTLLTDEEVEAHLGAGVRSRVSDFLDEEQTSPYCEVTLDDGATLIIGVSEVFDEAGAQEFFTDSLAAANAAGTAIELPDVAGGAYYDLSDYNLSFTAGKYVVSLYLSTTTGAEMEALSILANLMFDRVTDL